ncbi:MAG: hypothetical protein EOO27_03245 [Comamonadaceae bacterium]|nr:MAG: hypothetical protein EOO27_03245 [Comamonadaceae bacterium]
MTEQEEARAFLRLVDMCGLADNLPGFARLPAGAASMLATLQARLGVQIVVDGPPRPSLTPVGTQYLQSLGAHASLASDAAFLDDREVRGEVRLQVPAAFAVHQLAKHLPRFHARFPSITVQASAFYGSDPGGKAADLALVLRDVVPHDNWVAHRLAISERVLCASPDYLDRRGRPSQPMELGRHALLLPPLEVGQENDLILYRGPAHEDRSAQEACRVELKAIAPLVSADMDMPYAGALAGLGICALPSFVVEDALLEGALERVLPAWGLEWLRLAAWSPTRGAMTEPAQCLLNFLLAVFSANRTDPWLMSAGSLTER